MAAVKQILWGVKIQIMQRLQDLTSSRLELWNLTDTLVEEWRKLKAESARVLHCHHAHEEDKKILQWRGYWTLNEQLEHIFFVHYKETKKFSNNTIETWTTQLPATISQISVRCRVVIHPGLYISEIWCSQKKLFAPSSLGCINYKV